MTFVELKGGLGNQLFQLSFALWLRNVVGETTGLDTSWFHGESRGGTPRELEVDLTDQGFKIVRSPIFRALGSALGFRLHERHRDEYWRIVEREPRFPRFVDGYFQHWHLAEQTREPLWSLAKSHLGEITDVREVVMAHIRLGDYQSDPETRSFHGVTDPCWSIAEAKRLAEELGVSKVEIFTDSPRILRELAGDALVGCDIDNGIGSWQTLSRMMSCSAFVLSNSTFSWWAATFARWAYGHTQAVICPYPWFSAQSCADGRLQTPGWIIKERKLLQA